MRTVLGHTGHLLRVAVLFVAALLAFLLLQGMLVPAGFGKYGHYRAGALDDNRTRRAAHAGRAACVECHGPASELLERGRHASVRCEACHGPLARHAADPASVAVVKPEAAALCARCHQQLTARPAGFPQVDASAHSGGESCTACHAPHDPLDAASHAGAPDGDSRAAPAQKGGAR